MTVTEVQDIARSVLTHYGLDASVGRVTSTGREWQVEIIDASRGKTVVTVRTDTAQGVRRAILGAFHMEG
jgi:hypothetical protein